MSEPKSKGRVTYYATRPRGGDDGMNSKTYGQILIDGVNSEMFIRDRQFLYSEEAHERIARAVILEFIRRVEEEALAWQEDVCFNEEIVWENKIRALGQAFRKLSTEIKEAK